MLLQFSKEYTYNDIYRYIFYIIHIFIIIMTNFPRGSDEKQELSMSVGPVRMFHDLLRLFP